MVGLGKVLKQAQKVQKQMEALQQSLAVQEIEISRGGGAVVVKINLMGEFRSIKVDPEFLKEDAATVEETLLDAIQSAAVESKTRNEAEMGKVTAGFNLPGFM